MESTETCVNLIAPLNVRTDHVTVMEHALPVWLDTMGLHVMTTVLRTVIYKRVARTVVIVPAVRMDSMVISVLNHVQRIATLLVVQ